MCESTGKGARRCLVLDPTDQGCVCSSWRGSPKSPSKRRKAPSANVQAARDKVVGEVNISTSTEQDLGKLQANTKSMKPSRDMGSTALG